MHAAPRGSLVPLQHTALSARGEDEVTAVIRRLYVDNETSFVSASHGATFDATFDATTVAADGWIRADRVRTSIPYRSRADPLEHHLFLTAVTGRVEFRSHAGSARLAPGSSAMYPVGVDIDVEVHDAEVRLVQLPVTRLQDAVASVGDLDPEKLQFAGVEPISPSMRHYWKAMCGVAHGALHAPDSPLEQALLTQSLSSALALAALHTFPNNAVGHRAGSGPGAVAPAVVRRAVAFIEAHAHEPIGPADISVAAGTSARALQYAFRRHYDLTPSGYLRHVRLHRAHRDLQDAHPGSGVTVKDVAQAWGFASNSRFAAAYREVFGRTPGSTLRE